MVKVVCGIIENDEEILIAKKVEKEHPANLGGKWHFPGGKVDENETLPDALRREIKEETNLDIEVKELLMSNFVIRGKVKAEVFYFRCVPQSFELKPDDDVEELKWVDKNKVLGDLDSEFKVTLPEELIAWFKVT